MNNKLKYLGGDNMISDETLINEYSILKKPITTISKEYNIGTSTVFRKLKKLGLVKEKSLPEISKNDLYKLYITDNLSIAKIAEAYNVSTKYILTKLNKYEIKKDTSGITSSRIKTNLEKYGSENPSSSDIIKNKRKETVKSKYKAAIYRQAADCMNSCFRELNRMDANTQAPLFKDLYAIRKEITGYFLKSSSYRHKIEGLLIGICPKKMLSIHSLLDIVHYKERQKQKGIA